MIDDDDLSHAIQELRRRVDYLTERLEAMKNEPEGDEQ